MVDVKAREKQLRDRLAELEGRLHGIDDHLGQRPDQDWEDRATESAMDQVLEGLGHAGNAETQAIYAALARLKDGTYGVCARCGDDISEDRLDVLLPQKDAAAASEPLVAHGSQGLLKPLRTQNVHHQRSAHNLDCRWLAQRRSDARWTQSALHNPALHRSGR